MKNFIRNWFSPLNLSEADDQNRRVLVVKAVTHLALTFLALFIISCAFDVNTPLSKWVIIFLMLANLGLVIYWLQKKRVLLAGIWFLCAAHILLAVLIVTLGTIRSPITATYILLVIMAGILFEGRGILVATLASSVIVLGFEQAESAGLLPNPDFSVSITQWFTYTILFSLAGGLTYFAYSLISQALIRARVEIEERRRAETELRKLSTVVEQSPSSIFITDLQGKLEYVNPSFTQTTGCTSAEAFGKDPCFLRTSLTPPETIQDLREAVKNGKTWRGELVNRKKDGTIIYDATIISPVTDLSGNITNYLGVQEDISEVKKIRLKITQQRDLSQSLASATSINAALQFCLEFALDVFGLECGGIYLLDRATQDLNLIVSRGLSEAFLAVVAHVPAGSPRWQIVMAGKAIYTVYDQIRTQNSPVVIQEGLRAIGLVPILNSGQVIASFNLSSRSLDEIPLASREMIEEVAVQISQALVRIMAQEDLKQSHDELSRAQARYSSLFSQMNDAVFLVDLQGNHMAVNQRAADMLGYTLEEASRLTINETSAELDNTRKTIARLLAGEHVPLYERTLRRKDGQIIPVEVNIELARDANGTPLHIQSIVREISERKKIENALRASETRFRSLFEQSSDAIFICDLDYRFLMANQKALDLLGYTLDELFFNISLLDISAEPAKSQEVCSLLLAGQNLPFYESIFRNKRGQAFPVEISVQLIRDEEGKPIHIPFFVREIAKRKAIDDALRDANELLSRQVMEVEQLHLQLREQALRDPLTRLFNRRFVNEMLPLEIQRVEREGEPLSMIICDIDHFKRVNDSFGHQVGDRVLFEIAQMLKQNARGAEIACRQGGEEFLLILPGTPLLVAVERSEEIRQKCAEIVIMHEDQPIRVTMSFGVASFPQHGVNPDEIIVKADKAMYLSKTSGRNRVTVWDEAYVSISNTVG